MVDHSALLKKLEHYGIRGSALSWLQAYLANRSQYVNLGTARSVPKLLKYGVPQGSILGPLLFIIYINDLPGITNIAEFIFFADDANIIITGTDMAEIVNKLESVLPKIENWVDSNGLKMNLKKTKYMLFANRNKKLDDVNIHISNTKIERTEEERFLGITMDSKLNWNAHRQKLASKLSRNVGVLRRLKGIVPLKVIKLLYSSFIQSHLYYCPTVWGLAPKSTLEKIFSAQKKAIRLTSSKFINHFYNKETGELPGHTKPIFNEHSILTVHNIVYLQTLAFLQKVYNNIAPVAIRSLFEINTEQPKPTQLRAVKELKYFKAPRTRKTAFDNTIFVKGPVLYNGAANEFNRTLNITNPGPKKPEPYFQNKFTRPFKTAIKSLLRTQQSLEIPDQWTINNFSLYNQLNT